MRSSWVGACWRRSSGSARAGGRTSRAARGRGPTELTAEQERLCLDAARALDVEYAGVDLLHTADGRDHVLELNGIPGWYGLQESTGADVAAALVTHVEGLVGAARRAPPRR